MTKTNILNSLKNRHIRVFCIKDMLIYGNYKSVAKSIERLALNGDIKRLSQGIYYYPSINKTFNQEYPPEINDIAEAIGRNNNWEIRETGSIALYKLGLDNQIPVKFVYLSSGPYKTYFIGNRMIEFKNAAQKNFVFDKKTSLIIQALKTIGDKRITNYITNEMSSILNNKEKAILFDNIIYCPVWMHKYIKQICGAQNE